MRGSTWLKMYAVAVPAALCLSVLVCGGCNRAESSAISMVSEEPTAAEPSEGWPALFGPQRDSVSRERGVATTWDKEGPPELWRQVIGVGYSSPVVVKDRLIVLHREGDVECLDALDPITGQRIWRDAYPTTYECPVEYSDGPYSTPAIHRTAGGQQVVVSVSAQGVMSCLTLADGTVRWRRDLHAEYPVEPWLFPVGSSPLVEEGLIYFNLGSIVSTAGVIALRVEDGSTAWTATDDGPGYATPLIAAIHGRRYLFVVTFEGLVALDPATGRLHWRYDMKRSAPDAVNATSPVVIDDRVYMVTGPGPGAVCLRVNQDGTYERQWRDRRVLDSQFNTLWAIEDRLYGFTAMQQGGPTFRCVEATTGNLRWHWRSDLGRGSGLAVGGAFLLWGEDGHLASLSMRDDKPVELAPVVGPLLDGHCYASPALCEGRLYLRNEGTLLCLDLRAKP